MIGTDMWNGWWINIGISTSINDIDEASYTALHTFKPTGQGMKGEVKPEDDETTWAAFVVVVVVGGIYKVLQQQLNKHTMTTGTEDIKHDHRTGLTPKVSVIVGVSGCKHGVP